MDELVIPTIVMSELITPTMVIGNNTKNGNE